ncbi:putative subtilase-type serine protease precursor [compost metagenome]
MLGLRGESTTASGTSYAAAQVTGAVAAVLAAQPGLQPEQVRQLLYDSARDVEAAGFDPDTGYGAVQMDEALKLVRTGGYGSLKTGRTGLEGPL